MCTGRGIGLRPRDPRNDWERGSAREQKLPAVEKFHQFLPSVFALCALGHANLHTSMLVCTKIRFCNNGDEACLAVAAPAEIIEGAVIADVSRGSPAGQVGIQKGDIIVAAGGAPIRSAAQLRNKISLTPIWRAYSSRLGRLFRPRTKRQRSDSTACRYSCDHYLVGGCRARLRTARALSTRM
jgi:hypothetical protein